MNTILMILILIAIAIVIYSYKDMYKEYFWFLSKDENKPQCEGGVCKLPPKNNKPDKTQKIQNKSPETKLCRLQY